VALEILSGRRINSGIAQRKVVVPRMIYIHLQGFIVLSICPTANASKLATKPPTEFPENHTPTRIGISSRVYHVEVRNMKPGVIVASAMPRRNRTTKRLLKL
jgi:hypothetical protein